MQKILSWSDKNSITILKKSLEQSKVSLVSTDTILGFLAPCSPQGFHELNRIKKRFEKPYLVLISDISKVAYFAGMPLSEDVQKIMKQCWPAPLTLIVQAKDGIPSFLISPQKTIALRVPNHQPLQELLQQCNGLFSTSANFAGESVPENIKHVNPEILQKIDYVVLDETTDQHIPSTILDCTKEVIAVVREGAYTRDMIKEKTGIDIR